MPAKTIALLVLVNLLWADEVDMNVKPARRHNHALGSNDFCACAHNHILTDTFH